MNAVMKFNCYLADSNEHFTSLFDICAYYSVVGVRGFQIAQTKLKVKPHATKLIVTNWIILISYIIAYDHESAPPIS